MRRFPKNVRRKEAKGHEYLYFDTGQRTDKNQPILTRLPDFRDPGFSRAVAAAQAARDKRGNAPNAYTVAMMANAFEKSPKFGKFADKTQTIYSLYLRQIRERLGIAVAADLEPSDVVFVRDEMGDRPGAANQFVRVLGALYKWGRENQKVKNDPVKDVTFFDQGEWEPWPEWLLDEALESDDATVRLAVGMLYYTAQRIGDVVRMRWTDINDGYLRWSQQKTDTDLTIPLHSALRTILAETPRSGLLIVLRDGEPWKPELLRRYLQRWARVRNQEIVAHGLRKNAVIALLEAGCSIPEAAAVSGQSFQMVEHYAKRRNKKGLATAAIHRLESKNKAGKGKPK